MNQLLWRNISYHLSYTALSRESAKCYFTTWPNYFQTYLLVKHEWELCGLKNFTNHNKFYIVIKAIYGQYIISAHDNKLPTTSASLARHKVQKPCIPRCTILLFFFFFGQASVKSLKLWISYLFISWRPVNSVKAT